MALQDHDTAHAQRNTQIIRELLRDARGKEGGELAIALLNVMTVLEGWRAASTQSLGIMMTVSAVDEMLTALERGLVGQEITP